MDAVPGFVPRRLRDSNVGLFHAEDRVFEAMLDGWRPYNVSGSLAADLPAYLTAQVGAQEVLGWTQRQQIGVLLHEPASMEATAQSLVRALGEFGAASSDNGHAGERRARVFVGGARFPDDGGTMEDLLDAAHRAVRMASEGDGSPVALRPTADVALERYRAARAR